MAAKGKRRQMLLAKKAQKKASMHKPGGESNYAKKKKWCDAHGLFAFQVEGFPWRGSK